MITENISCAAVFSIRSFADSDNSLLTFEICVSEPLQAGGDFVFRYNASSYFAVDGSVSAVISDAGDESSSDADVTVSDSSVSVSGFDFGADDTEKPRKLIIKVPLKGVAAETGSFPAVGECSGMFDARGNLYAEAPQVELYIPTVLDLGSNKTRLPHVEKFFLNVFGNTAYFKKLWPTLSSLRRVGENIYLLDYQYDYDIDDLMQHGAASALKLLSYASRHILGGGLKFKEGEFGGGCSAFEAYNESGEYIMGRNFDYMDGPCYVVWTHPKNAYASISMVDANFLLTFDRLKPATTMGRFQALKAPYLCLDGMNEKGLVIAVLQIHADGTKQDTGKIKMFTTAMIRICLDKCATVNEAIELFKTFDVQDTIALGYSLGCCFHYMLTDANGDSAVIEYVNNEIRVIRAEDMDSDKLFVANFYLSEDGGRDMEAYDPEGMERYDMIKAALEQNGNVLNFDQTFDLLSDVHLNYRHNNNLYDITTLWSCLYNNKQLTMSLAARMDYGKIYTFSVKEPMCVHSIDSVEVKMPIEGIDLR